MGEPTFFIPTYENRIFVAISLAVIPSLNEKKLKKKDFTVTEDYHTRLREQTSHMLIAKLRVNFNKSTPYKKKNYAYENIHMDNVQQLANYIMDKNPRLTIDIPNIEIPRQDDLELMEKILYMTPEERRKLGINQSTLWYMKQNLRDGKRISVNNKVKGKFDRPT